MFIVIIFSVLVVLVLFKVYKVTEPPKTSKKLEPQTLQLSDAEREAMRQADEVWDMTTYLSIMQGEYTGPLPEHIVGGHWTDLYPDIYRTKIAGINFRKDAKSYAGQYVDAMLYADPKNEYDPNAIKIVTTDYVHLGFIPADETAAVREWVNKQFPIPCRARIDERTDYDELDESERTYLIGNICINKPNK